MGAIDQSVPSENLLDDRTAVDLSNRIARKFGESDEQARTLVRRERVQMLEAALAPSGRGIFNYPHDDLPPVLGRQADDANGAFGDVLRKLLFNLLRSDLVSAALDDIVHASREIQETALVKRPYVTRRM